MNYFTPELLAECRSDDEAVAGAASEKWEEQATAYAKSLERIRQFLPNQFRILLDGYYLHDSKVSFAGLMDQKYLITLKLDTPPHNTLFLTYELSDIPELAMHSTAGSTVGPIEWLYDEVELCPPDSIRREPLNNSFTHSILLSDGMELHLTFRNFSFVESSSTQVFVSGSYSHTRPELARVG
jgi:hypothetical protein